MNRQLRQTSNRIAVQRQFLQGFRKTRNESNFVAAAIEKQQRFGEQREARQLIVDAPNLFQIGVWQIRQIGQFIVRAIQSNQTRKAFDARQIANFLVIEVQMRNFSRRRLQLIPVVEAISALVLNGFSKI